MHRRALAKYLPRRLEALCLCTGLLALAGPALVHGAEMKQDITAWLSQENQALSPRSRCDLLNTMGKAAGSLDGNFILGVVQKDPATDVKLCAIDKLARQTDVKRWRRIVDVIIPALRDDRELLFGTAEIIYNVRGKAPDFKAAVLGSLIKWASPLPYPETVPASGKVKVEWVSQSTGKPAILEMDAAEAKRAREMVEKTVEMFNQIAGTSIKPGPKFGEEMKRWNAKYGGKAIEAEIWLSKGKTILKAPDQAKLVTSTMLGTPGTEWFSGGGFQPDGTVVLAGVSLGPTLDFPGVRTTVVGTDQPAPPAPVREVLKTGEEGEPVYKTYRWSHPQGTPFVVRLSPDTKKIISVSRLPWCSGGVTGAWVDEAGNIYLAGPARAGIRQAGGDVKELDRTKRLERPPPKTPPPKADAPSAPNPDAYEQVYVARLSPAGDKVIWIRLLDNPNSCTYPPDLGRDLKGRLVLTGPDQRVLSLDGQQLVQWHPISTNRFPSPKCAIEPERGLVVFAGEHHWPTGHEPWRCPYVTINKPDGAGFLTLYDWPGPFVGGAAGLVADSPLFGARFDLNGDLVLMGWSDGGNSVLYGEPLDVLRGAHMRGLGLSGAGVHGAIGFGYIVRVSTKTWRVIGGTMLCASTPQYGPNSMSVSDVYEAADRSLMMVGGSAWGAPQSPHNLCVGHPAGEYIAVLKKDCTTLRFGASMQACGDVELRSSRWGMATGRQNGRPMALFLTGAVATNNVYGREAGPPAYEPLQPKHAGGHLDGYFTLLDLEYTPAPAALKTEDKKR